MRETPSNPFGRPSFVPEDLAFGEALTGALGDEITLDLGEQRENERHYGYTHRERAE